MKNPLILPAIIVGFAIIAGAILVVNNIHNPTAQDLLAMNIKCHDKAVAFEDQLKKRDIWLINVPESTKQVNDNTYVYSYNIAGYSYSQKYSTCFAHYGMTRMPNYDYYGKNLPKGTDINEEFLGDIYDTVAGVFVAGVDPQIDCPNKPENCNKAWENFDNKAKSLDLE